jgi:hypothetical protein
MVDTEDARRGQGGRVEALELARAAGIVALGEEGLEDAVANVGDEEVDDAEEGEGESHCGGWRGGVTVMGEYGRRRLVGVDAYIYTNIWERIASTEERRNWRGWRKDRKI